MAGGLVVDCRRLWFWKSKCNTITPMKEVDEYDFDVLFEINQHFTIWLMLGGNSLSELLNANWI